MAKGIKGSSGGQYDHADLPTHPSSRTPGDRQGTTTPDKDGYSVGTFTIEPYHRATGVSAEEAIKKTYERDD